MTAPLRNTQHASNIAAITASQNSAPVAEFRCLFTQDIRRKQKRWQDGYLKFHSFNSRVMVYDQARNFLGDTYYKDSDELHEGDELTLNNGALVEVSEAMGITHTDLTQLLEKKAKSPPPPRTAASQTKPFQRPSAVAPTNAQRNGSQLRHKSLNTLLGTPKGPIWKAQLMKSPYEARKEQENEQVEERAPKRQKIAQPPANWRASSPTQEESPIAKKDAPSGARIADAKNIRRPTKFVPPAAANVITIESESDPHPAFLSDVTLPSTPPNVARARAETRVLVTPAPKPAAPEKLPVQTPRIPRGKVPVPSVKALETPTQVAPASSPPVSVSNRLTNVDSAVQRSKIPAKAAPQPIPDPPPNRKTKSLRLSTGVKRGRLLCQSLPQEASRAGSEPRTAGTKARSRQESCITSKEPSPAILHNSIPHVENGTSAVIDRPSVTQGKRKGVTADDEDAGSKRARVSKSPTIPTPSVFDDPEAMHGLMDQQLLVPSSPLRPREPSPPPAKNVVKPKPVVTKKAASKKPIASKQPEEAAIQSRAPWPKVTTRKTQARKKVVDKPAPAPAPAPKASLPSAPVREPPARPPREVSPAHTEASDTRSRTSSTSPRKIPLSTGGFTKRPEKHKRKQKQAAPTPPVVEVSAAAPRNESVPLPPHPLRANKKGPLMSTTQLAALLQKPKILKKGLADPIEDGGAAAGVGLGKSPNRAFRRVRSQNDTPIPSAAEDWEKRNLPKTTSNLTDIVDEPPVVLTGQEEPKKKISALSALIKKTDPRGRFKRTNSLQVDTHVGAGMGVGEVELPSPVVDLDVGPWSTEAGDLFSWRPPGKD